MIRNGWFGMLSWTRVHGYQRDCCWNSPHAFGSLHQDGKVLLVNLTRKQIENSTSIETHKPVSRQYEEEYCRYYRWPSYWQGDAMCGMSGFPVIPPPCPLPSTQAIVGGGPHYGDDLHLRSTQLVSGYHIQASDGMIGHVTDFMMDDKSWAICQRGVVLSTSSLHEESAASAYSPYTASKAAVSPK
jgi:hypothetical protein